MELSQPWINLFLGRLQNHFGYKKAPGGLKSTHPAYTSNLPSKIWGRLMPLSRAIRSILCSTRRLHTTSVSRTQQWMCVWSCDYCLLQWIICNTLGGEIRFFQQNNKSNFHIVMKKAFLWIKSNKGAYSFSKLEVVVWNKPSRGKHHIERDLCRRSVNVVLLNFNKLDFNCPIWRKMTWELFQGGPINAAILLF